MEADGDCLTSVVGLDQCQRLQAVPHIECTHFYQFVLLKTNPPTSGKTPDPSSGQVAKFPSQAALKDPGFLKRVEDSSNQIVQNLSAQRPSLQPASPVQGGGPVSKVGQVTVKKALLSKADLQKLGQVMRSQYLAMQGSAAVQPQMANAPATARMGFILGADSVDLGQVLAPYLDAIKAAAALAAQSQPQAVWAVGLDYKQCWKSRGYVRGRLVRSLPLTPGEQLEIVVKTWAKQTQTTTQVESVEQNLSNEVTNEEKWMLASKMTFSDQTNAGINPSAGAKAGVSVPTDSVTIDGGGNLGIQGNLSEAITHATDTGIDYTQSSMLKAAESLKSVRSNSVELVSETGTETTSKQVIANTNRCRTLTYHYFEVLENFQVTTGLVEAQLYLLLPLPLPDITPEWVLCHECYLRKVLPCDVFYAGLAAAKQLLSWQKADALAPNGNWWAAGEQSAGSNSGADSSGLDAAVRDVLNHWQKIKTAGLWVQTNSGNGFWNGVAAGTGQVAQGVGTVVDGAKNGDVSEVESGLGDVVGGIRQIGQAAIDNAPSAPGLPFAFHRDNPLGGNDAVAGGPGTFLWREIAHIVSPEIQESLDYLALNWQGTQNFPVQVLAMFFGKLGDPEVAFRKVEIAIGAAAGAAVAAGGVGGGILGAIIGGVAASEIPGVSTWVGVAGGGAAGAAIGAGAVAAVIALMASVEALGIADTIPDDAGLKNSVEQLKAVYDSSIASIPAQMTSGDVSGGPGATGATAPTAASGATEANQYRQYLLDRATAQVEFDRLRCHLQENLVSYMQGLWSQWPDYEILDLIKSQGIPTEVVEPRFAGFLGALGAVPVTDQDWLMNEGDFDWAQARTDVLAAAKQQTKSNCITLPTPGMTVEAALGQCCACEDYIEKSRDLELQKKQAKVDLLKARAAQAQEEAARFKRRLEKDMLSDPTPLEDAKVDLKGKLKDFEP
jgi:hypothetical protein